MTDASPSQEAERGDTADAVYLDIQPEYGPRVLAATICLASGVGFALLSLIVGFTSRRNVVFNSMFFMPVALPLLVFGAAFLRKALRWRRWVQENRPHREELASHDEPLSEDELAFLHEYCMRANWPEPSMHAATHLFASYVDLKLARPRAIAIGPAAFTRALGESLSDEAIEPIKIRSWPNLKSPIPWLRHAVEAMFIMYMLLIIVATLAAGYSSGQMLWVRISAGFITPAMFLYGLANTTARLHGFAPFGGPGLIAGPSRLEWHGLYSKDSWSPDDTMLVVRRSRVGARAMLMRTTGAIRTLWFYGDDDAGLLRLWRMWNHPQRVESLLETEEKQKPRQTLQRQSAH